MNAKNFDSLNPFWGKYPELGDRVYVDFGDSVITGGEAIGWVIAIDTFGGITLADSTGAVIEEFLPTEAVHIEVVE
jgi:hypothetical protein